MDELNTTVEPLTKKRGRKRKLDMSKTLENDANISVVATDSTSKRGRKRKQINYYELANPGTLDVAIINESAELAGQSTSVAKPKIKTPPKTIEKNTTATNEPKKVKAETNGNKEANGNPSSAADAKNTEFDNEDGINRRYNYTGETVKMMSQLFKAFTPKKEEESGNNNLQNGNNDAGPKKQNDNVVCAVCNETVAKTVWLHHNQRYHNNLAWRVGDEPLDLTDQTFVMYTLNALYKKKKPLYCEKCGKAKKSVVGFLSHQSTCGKVDEQLESVRVSCELCGKKMLPVSMMTHIKFVHANKDSKEETPKADKKVKDPKLAPSNRRTAAKKALKIIENCAAVDSREDSFFSANFDFEAQEFAVQLMQEQLAEKQYVECPFRCKFLASALDAVFKHCAECAHKPNEGFVCKKCLFIENKLEDIIYHVESVHNLCVNIDEEDDEEFEKGDQRIPNYLDTVIRKTEDRLFPFAYSWTTEFQQRYYSSLLFPKLIQNEWFILDKANALHYLPKLPESCDFAHFSARSFTTPKITGFEKLNLFQSKLSSNTKLTLFCGGPISAMAWLPTNNPEQILAVAILQSPDDKCSWIKNYRTKQAIQFWSFGKLLNKQGIETEPKLMFNLAHDHGPVWHMEWCPSGCSNDGRIGLLAVTGSDSVVYIYSIPFFDSGLYYKTEPAMKLTLQRPNSQLLGGVEYYPVKISWTKAKGHRYLAVGYTNGTAALFHLFTQSVLLKYHDEGGVCCFLPEKKFQAHSHLITILQLHHLNDGRRWLLTGSLDRGISLWDLNDLTYPIFTTRKNIYSCGLWMTHWLNFVAGLDENSTAVYVSSGLKTMREYLTDSTLALTIGCSTISTLASSDWLNCIMHGNVAGEVMAMFPHQLHQPNPYAKLTRKKRMLFGFTYLFDKTKTCEERNKYEKKWKRLFHATSATKSYTTKLAKEEDDSVMSDEPLVYNVAESRYGLVFCDNPLESFEDFPNTASQLSACSKLFTLAKANQYPLGAINQIQINPNCSSSLFYASGHQAGFVRVSWMKFLRNDPEIR